MVDSLARPGGGERLAVEGAVGLDPALYERWFVITRWDERTHSGPGPDALLERLRAADVRLLTLPRRSKLSLGAWRPLLTLLRSGRVDVLHAHLFGSNLWASVLGSLARVPVIVAHEHMWSYGAGSRLRPLLDRQVIARGADAFVAVSREGVRGMVERERIPPARIAYVPNGVRPLPGGDGARLRAEFGIAAEVPLVVSVGHLRPEKAFETLVVALAELRARSRDVRVLIAGEGPERARLEQLARDRGVADALLLPGARDDVADILDAAQVAVCCSRFEGGPLSVMEYFQAGLPVVASRVGGLPELVSEGVNGMLVPAADPSRLAEAIAELLDDPERRRRLGAAGADLVRRDYAIDVWIRRLRTLYGDLLYRAGRRLDH